MTNEPTSLLGIEREQSWWVVDHRDNSDHGRVQRFFLNRYEAEEYATTTKAQHPSGNVLHPAPTALDLRLFLFLRYT